ncbi:Uncharacterised protein [uncultured archaeon]|nr:Uncharacterised protein [uncultured archaeon]
MRRNAGQSLPLGRVKKFPERYPLGPEHRATSIYRIFSELAGECSSMKPSRLVMPTPAIIKWAHAFSGRTLLEKAKAIGDYISAMPLKKITLAKLKSLYAKRPAEKILASGVIYLGPELHEVPESVRGRFGVFPHIGGCVDDAHLAIAGLRALGLPAAFLRFEDHSFAVFPFKGEIYCIDPNEARMWKRKIPVLRKLTSHDFSRILSGNYRLGRDAKGIGLSFDNFF